jgi:hypothetical protein
MKATPREKKQEMTRELKGIFETTDHQHRRAQLTGSHAIPNSLTGRPTSTSHSVPSPPRSLIAPLLHPFPPRSPQPHTSTWIPYPPPLHPPTLLQAYRSAACPLHSSRQQLAYHETYPHSIRTHPIHGAPSAAAAVTILIHCAISHRCAQTHQIPGVVSATAVTTLMQ